MKSRKGKQIVEKVVKVFNPYLMTAHEGGGIKVFKVTARYLEGGRVLLENSIAPLNLVRKADGSCVSSTRVTVYDPLSPWRN